MKKARKDPVRENRIHNEAIADAGPEEQALSWYYYLEDKLRFPFQAKCLAAKAVSPLRKGETVEVLHMAPDDVCEHDRLVRSDGTVERWPSRSLNSLLSIQTNQPLKPSATGITGCPRVIASDLRTAPESSLRILR